MQPPIFHEVQYAETRTFLLVAFIGVVVSAGTVVAGRFYAPFKNRAVGTTLGVGLAAFVLLLCTAILLFYGKMTTEVTGSEVRVRFGWLTSHAEAISIAEIQQADAVGYDSVGEYGGWGIRSRGPNDRALNQWGDQGVRLRLEGGRSLLLGSQRPEDLAGAIAQARQQAGKGP